MRLREWAVQRIDHKPSKPFNGHYFKPKDNLMYQHYISCDVSFTTNPVSVSESMKSTATFARTSTCVGAKTPTPSRKPETPPGNDFKANESGPKIGVRGIGIPL
mmetsp:Transcript_5859/g.7604  ORF Transcript_5859/g.7604 Transcript_5859/m.7604 type:complete len:104 (+) Transcript_5859:107-418(+)